MALADAFGSLTDFRLLPGQAHDLRGTAALIDGLELFGIGFSWGGFESLVIPADPEKLRSAVPWEAEGPLVRVHIGLEDPDDLIADLAAGLARFESAAS